MDTLVVSNIFKALF